DENLLADRVSRSGLLRLPVEAERIELAAHEVALHQLVHLLQLERIVRDKGDLRTAAGDRRFRALEVEPRGDLALHAFDRVVDLGEVGLGDDVEAGHAGYAPRTGV